jgi:hypothetical protein
MGFSPCLSCPYVHLPEIKKIIRQDDVKKLIQKRRAISALKKFAPGCLISDRWALGIDFGSDEISAESIFSHLPDGTGTFGKQFLKVPVPSEA